MDKIVSTAKKHDLLIIEDCAQSFGAEIRGKKQEALEMPAASVFTHRKTLVPLVTAGWCCYRIPW